MTTNTADIVALQARIDELETEKMMLCKTLMHHIAFIQEHEERYSTSARLQIIELREFVRYMADAGVFETDGITAIVPMTRKRDTAA